MKLEDIMLSGKKKEQSQKDKFSMINLYDIKFQLFLLLSMLVNKLMHLFFVKIFRTIQTLRRY